MNINELREKIDMYKRANIDYSNASTDEITKIVDNSNDVSIYIGHPLDILFIAMEEIVELLDAIHTLRQNEDAITSNCDYMINFIEEFVDVRVACVKVIRYISEKYNIDDIVDMNYLYPKYTNAKVKVCILDIEEQLYSPLIILHSAISKYARMNNYTSDEDQIKIISNLLNAAHTIYVATTTIGSNLDTEIIYHANTILDIKIARQKERDMKISK